ncbi:CRISPR-associated protein Cas4 [Pontibacter qinzhouensis]|uniref:CRISPR-associated exonuclease Cas4 n=1 Tax=Pontibacter qinzhouensis TaxID=2603253 RepID=A0A5C8J705_9BACT|nr:CRISPR-associated protein Cas4 [Pontibacter qinzhouensis]TXK33289.1 CRISPR-associated protein Cas4 [Pontibacter qinzhouensis]
MSLTPSHIIEYLYCPRFTYFEYVLGIPQYETKNYKVMRGREVHDQKLEQNKEYLRKKIGVQEKFVDQYLTNDLLRGRIDEVLLLQDGTMAPLDYKFAQFKDKIYDTYRTQLYCYAWLIEQNFGKKVDKGFLVYTRSQNKLVEVPILETDKKEVENCVKQIYHIIEENHFPKATKYRKRCLDCTYRNVCVK